MQKVTFNISKRPSMVFLIDHATKTAKLVNQPHELSASVLLTKQERTYKGIEKRLNFLTNRDLNLKDHLERIKKGDFYADAQRNLNITVED